MKWIDGREKGELEQIKRGGGADDSERSAGQFFCEGTRTHKKGIC